MNARLDETNITLNDRTNVFHPLDRAFLMLGNRASSESIKLSVHPHPSGSGHLRFNVSVDHSRLVVIGGVLFSLEIPMVSLRQ